VVAGDSKRRTISVTGRTKVALDQIKHSGQSYEGLLQELIRLWKREHGIEEPGRAVSTVERREGD